ncbi:MAG: response regulator transcription factor [Anaerolineae bacterium]|nr:response regulator transcription factor [Anaerolineae bacterium]
MNEPINVAIIDDDEEFRQAVCGWLEEMGDIRVVGSASGGSETIHWLRQMQPDVVLIDVGTASVAEIREVATHAGVIVLHREGQEPLVLDAFQVGAQGHLDKQNIRPPQIIAAIRAVSRGEVVISPTVAGQILDRVVSRMKGENREGPKGASGLKQA